MNEQFMNEDVVELACAGCGLLHAPGSLAEGCCARCWADARRVRLHGHASVSLRGRAAVFCQDKKLWPSLTYDLQRLLEDVVEDAVNIMAYPETDHRGEPALYLRMGANYLPVAPLSHYPAPGVWLVEWTEHSRTTSYLSRFPVPDPIRLASAYRLEDAALREVARRDATTRGELVRAVLDVVGGKTETEKPRAEFQ